MSNRTDGVIADDDLPLLPATDGTRADELATLGLWQRHGVGWLIVDWPTTQTTRRDLESLENVRRWARETKQRQREKRAREEAAAEGVHVDSAPGHGTWTTQDRKGQASDRARTGDEVNRNHDVPRPRPSEDEQADWPPVNQPGSAVDRLIDDLWDREP